MERKLDDVVEALKRARERETKCSLLVGAGCSVVAGIPTAGGFVKEIKERFPRDYERSDPKTYPKCMAQLPVGERRELIKRFVDKARINWAHVCIAQLLKEGYVDRVLTTNFDLLVVRACALLGVFPAIYDFAASQLYRPADIPDRAVFYLHGQYTGFVLLNTEEECGKHSDLLRPVFQDAGQGRMWLVVGYSGENDPVFEHLASVPRFDYRLYWVGYVDSEPPQHVRERLLKNGKHAFYVRGFDADGFFATLTQKLGCFPPDFVGKPFSHLDSLLEKLTPYKIPGGEGDLDVTEQARKQIRAAISMYEREPTEEESAEPPAEPDRGALLARKANALLMAGDYDRVIAMRSEYDSHPDPRLAEPLAWAYFSLGNALFHEAGTKTGEESDRLFAEAGEKYAAALEIKPDKHGALYNWGIALAAQAERKTGAESDRLFAEAGEKYAAALEIKPDDHLALNNWGNALSTQAEIKRGEESDRLFAEAGEKYAAALEIKPDNHLALNNWGNALSTQAEIKRGEESDRLFAEAGEKYAAALEIKPDDHETLNNWGSALLVQAEMKTGEESDRLFDQADEKCRAAEAVAPGAGAYNLACIAALRGDESDCQRRLDRCYSHGQLPSIEHLEADRDLDGVREREWFKEFVEKVRAERGW